MGSLCCNAHQIDVIVAVCAYTVLILGTWRVDAVVKPFKLLAVFVHEGCHACACLATGGRVDGVEVNINEGGVTRYRGGCASASRRPATWVALFGPPFARRSSTTGGAYSPSRRRSGSHY